MSLSAHPKNPQMIERHIWRVIYKDGSEFSEYPLHNEHHSFDEVDKEQVHVLIVEPNHWLDATGPAFAVQLSDDMRPIMFRTVMVNADTNVAVRWHVFGWQSTIEGKNVKTLSYVSNDDPEAPVIQVNAPLF
jgi:hypothetical protein